MEKIESSLHHHLLLLSQHYKEFVSDYGDIVEVNDEILSDPERDTVVRKSKNIVKLAETVSSLMKMLITHQELPVYSDESGLLKYYQEIIEPVISEFHRVINPELWYLFDDFDFDITDAKIETSYPPLPLKKNKFKELLGDVFIEIDEYEDGYLSFKWKELEDELINLNMVINNRFFAPDSWECNIESLRPIEIYKTVEQLPYHVRERLREVISSFVYGNWFSCISTSRALMEYCIIDRARNISIDVYSSSEEKSVKKLSRIIESIDDKESDLKNHMVKVNSYGNDTMHPIKRKKIKSIVFGRNHALDCLRSLTYVIERLYCDEKSPNKLVQRDF